MAATLTRSLLPLHPFRAILLGVPVTLFPAALLSDIAYLGSAEMQWSNFSAWLITGGVVFGGFALLWAIVAAVRGFGRIVHLVLLAVMWVAGLVNAFQHSHDAWTSVGTMGLLLSIVCVICALAAGWTGYAALVPERRT